MQTTKPTKQEVREYFARRTHAPLDSPPSPDEIRSALAGTCCRRPANRIKPAAAEEVRHEIATSNLQPPTASQYPDATATDETAGRQ